MVSVKERLNPERNRLLGDRNTRKSAAAKCFKVYSEMEKAKVCGRDSVSADKIGNAVPITEGATQSSSSDSKELLNGMEKSKIKHIGPGKTNVGRKALGDVSNVLGPVSRTEAHNVSKPARKSVLIKERASQAGASISKGSLAISERRKSKTDSSDKVNVGEAAVADISNARGYNPKNDVYVCSKPVKGKSRLTTNLQRVSWGPSTRTISASSSKHLVTKTKANVSRDFGSYQVKRGVKDLKIYNDDGGKVQLRKSLPVLKRVNKVHTKNQDVEDSESSKEKTGFHGEIKANGRNAVPRVRNTRSHLWRNRASDGFLIKAPRCQSNVGAHGLPINSSKPTIKATSKYRCTTTSGSKKSIPISTMPSNQKEVLSHSLPESSHEELPSAGNSCTGTSTIIVTKKSSRRRRSYTSLLMARSKLLEEHGEVVKQDKLPSIDDVCNHLEVAEYIDDLYQYYWDAEAQNPSLANCMSNQKDISPHMRSILINWLIEVHYKFDLMQETLYLMVTLFDRYLSLTVIKKNEIQLVGLTALLLASKYEDFWHPKVKDLISISAESYTRDQMLGMEKTILKELKFRLNSPTPYVFMLRFIKAAQSGTKFEHLAFYLIELCLIEYEALKFKPSMLCASAIYVARRALQLTPSWTSLLGKHARYEESQLRECGEMILRFHRAAKNGELKVTYDKFRRPDRSCVAAIKALDTLRL